MIPPPGAVLSASLSDIEERILASAPTIERWFRQEWMEHAPPFYTSVDLRNAGFKLAPVDTNLYPGGWNNLPTQALPQAALAALATVKRYCPEARRLLLVPESHTRNAFYLKNVGQLQGILSRAGLEVRLGTMNAEIAAATRFDLGDGQHVTLEPLVLNGGRLCLADFDPCIVLLNNDLSAGIPAILSELHGQCMLPPLHAGWHVRRKSQHFKSYHEVAVRFGMLLGIDPWLINPLFSHCDRLDFSTGLGVGRLQSKVDTLLAEIRWKYEEYGVKEQPFVVVKADNGTYGMGIMTVRDASELEQLNRRARNKMATIRDGQEVSEVIIQEGVHTGESICGAPAEPVVYMMGRDVVGGFYRANARRGVDENLNAPGAVFVPLVSQASDPLTIPPGATPVVDTANRFYPYGVIGQLAALAASYELEATCLRANDVRFCLDETIE
ncbi:glutamate--cysteine ligase [Cupriavidus sp. 2SB]|uniref:glutamate--cysteine ligase n=1 Tax=Cupriavidus sp. 2SB TaxID=2502199 RepID=UPI0010F83CFB|nr:glutamate--cysteine ligase [Cupriavidus sp. 2SB]